MGWTIGQPSSLKGGCSRPEPGRVWSPEELAGNFGGGFGRALGLTVGLTLGLSLGQARAKTLVQARARPGPMTFRPFWP